MELKVLVKTLTGEKRDQLSTINPKVSPNQAANLPRFNMVN